MMKNFIKFNLLIVLTLCFASCNSLPESTPKNSWRDQESAPENLAPVDREKMRGLSAAQLVKEMKTGWNLGNTMDCINSGTGFGIENETSWGNPKTTKAMIDFVAAQGFDVLRVPVSWGEHMGDAPDFKINPAYMERVKEIVDYGIQNNMFVMLNCHHEQNSDKNATDKNNWLIPDKKHIDEADNKLHALWKQISKNFIDYGDHLVFEGMNECRTPGSASEWNGGTADERKNINRLNKTFIDTVRATGGNNSERVLFIPTYGHSDSDAALNDLWLPENDKFVAVATHNYSPWNFCAHPQNEWEIFDWNGSHNNEIDGMYSRLKKILDKGFPVVITEYGASPKQRSDGTWNTAEIKKWAKYYVSKGKESGIPCIVWDNGNNGPENQGDIFGLLNRKENPVSWKYPEIIQGIMDGLGE